MIFPKGNKLNSVLYFTCPRCHQGAFLAHPIYDFKHFVSVRPKCDKCDLKYRLEPSFYTGSMYVAYALGVAIMGLIALMMILFVHPFSFLLTFFTIVGVLVILSPYLNALSKIIWANLFFHFDPNVSPLENTP